MQTLQFSPECNRYYQTLAGPLKAICQKRLHPNKKVTLQDLEILLKNERVKGTEYSGWCVLYIEFVNVVTLDCSKYYPFVVDLHHPYWYTNLCIAAETTKVQTLDGHPIEYFGRKDVAKEGSKFMVHTHSNRDNFQVPVSHNVERHKIYQEWWDRFITKLKDLYLEFIAYLCENKLYSKYLNDGTFHKQFLVRLREFLSQPTQYEKYRHRKFSTFFEGVITLEQFERYIQSEYTMKVKYLLVSSKHVFKNYILQLNRYKNQSQQSIQPSREELGLFFNELISPLFVAAGPIPLRFQPSLKYNYSELNQHLQGMQVKCQPTKHQDEHFHGPIHEDVDSLKNHAYFSYFNNQKYQHSSDWKHLLKHSPFSLLHEVRNPVFVQYAPKVVKLNGSSFGDCEIPIEKIHLTYDHMTGEPRMKVEDNEHIYMIDPIGNRVRTHDNKEFMFHEVYDQLRNVHELKI